MFHAEKKPKGGLKGGSALRATIDHTFKLILPVY